MSTAMVLDDRDDWMRDARRWVVATARTGSTLSAVGLREELRAAPHPNMVGSVFRWAATRGYITPVTTIRSTTRSRRGSKVDLWTAGPNLTPHPTVEAA